KPMKKPCQYSVNLIEEGVLHFYQETNLILHYENESSNNVWKQIGIKQQENGSTLFGLNHTLGLWL
ncbi:5018_t:CDS:2, partial [Funneliformis geosporum]